MSDPIIVAEGPFRSEQFELTPAATGRAYQITVEVPSRYGRDDRAFPLVICLDGPWTFGIVRDSFRLMPLSRVLPEAVVVAVSHSDTDLKALMQSRAIDFTPTEATAPPETGVRVPAHEVGKAAMFRRALVDEIIPEISQRYRVNDDHTVVGHSFSALFALDTLLHEPSAFSRWVLASPSVWWDDRVMFPREAAHAEATSDIAGRVFMSAAGDEGVGYDGHRLFYEQFAARAYPSLDLRWEEFPGESHFSVLAPAIGRGLQAVFAP
ncbi:MAG: alpha/beta hydrolase-fold protein [Actinomycetota bacterium]